MAQSALTSLSVPEAEYSVYVYRYADDIEEGRTDWEMKVMTQDLSHAMEQAQVMHDSRDYKKIEVKKRYFDHKYQCVLDVTYKVLQDKRRVGSRAGVLALLGISGITGITVFVLPFVMTF